MQIFIDKNREKKRQETIRKSLSSTEESVKILQEAGILTSKGNIAPAYK